MDQEKASWEEPSPPPQIEVTAKSAHNSSVPEPQEVRQKLREAVKREKMSLETLLGKAETWVWNGSVLEISFKNSFEMSMAHKEQGFLQGKLKGFYGNHLSLAFKIIKESAVENEAAPSRFQEDEVIKTFLHVFQGKIVQKGEM